MYSRTQVSNQIRANHPNIEGAAPVTTVGIMSMQRIHNYGSSLQAYALRRLLEQADSSVHVSFVDYEPGATLLRPSSTSGLSASSRIIRKLREYNAVKTPTIDKLRFFNHKRAYARKYLPAIGIGPEPSRNLNLDLQVIGSDEVFNCVQDNSNVGYSRDLFGHGSPARHVVSYAASFGNTTMNKLESNGIRDEIATDLSRFTSISVRDRNSRDIVEALTGSRPQVHLDPTLVYDFSDESRTQSRSSHEKYIIVYGYSGRLDKTENLVIKQYADKIGARVLAFGGLQECADEFIDCTPFELLSYFRNASAVITDTFHGTIFSVINEVPFVTIVRQSSGASYGNEEKLGYLLEALGLHDRQLRRGDSLAEIMDKEIDFAPVRAVRSEERQRTQDYLASAIRLAAHHA